jgi:hypothetical protein
MGVQDKKYDANDYSRFENIVDPDDEVTETKQVSTEQPVECRNCRQSGAKLKCSICKKAKYCNRQCQTSDWGYHRRICKKPEEPKKDKPSEKRVDGEVAKSRPSSTSSSARSNKPKAAAEIVKEDEAIENAKGYVNGLPYFHREQTEEEKALIGDIAPKKIESIPAVVSEKVAVSHDGSAWNHAGTFEQRDVSKWAKVILRSESDVSQIYF